jgi:hypothetical protein
MISEQKNVDKPIQILDDKIEKSKEKLSLKM